MANELDDERRRARDRIVDKLRGLTAEAKRRGLPIPVSAEQAAMLRGLGVWDGEVYREYSDPEAL